MILATWLVALRHRRVACVRRRAAGALLRADDGVVPKDGAASSGVRSRVWHAGRRMRLEAGDAPGGPALVLRLDEGRALRLDPEAKVAVEIDPAALRARSHQDALGRRRR